MLKADGAIGGAADKIGGPFAKDGTIRGIVHERKGRGLPGTYDLERISRSHELNCRVNFSMLELV
jgi:hypothetical protein